MYSIFYNINAFIQINNILFNLFVVHISGFLQFFHEVMICGKNATLTADDIYFLNQEIDEVNDLLSQLACQDSISLICHPRFYSNRYLLAKDGLHLSPEGVEVLSADFKVFNRVVIPGDNLHQTNASYCLTSQDDFPPLNSVSVNFTRKQTLIGGGKTLSVGAEFDNYPEFKACFTEWCEDRFHPVSIQARSQPSLRGGGGSAEGV